MRRDTATGATRRTRCDSSERRELAAERREVTRLDLDQEAGAHEVDDVRADLLLGAVPRLAVPLASAARGARPRSASRSRRSDHPGPITIGRFGAARARPLRLPRRSRSSRASVSASSRSRRSPRVRSECSGGVELGEERPRRELPHLGAGGAAHGLVGGDDGDLLAAPVLGGEPLDQRVGVRAPSAPRAGRAPRRRRARRRRARRARPSPRPSSRAGRAARPVESKPPACSRLKPSKR